MLQTEENIDDLFNQSERNYLSFIKLFFKVQISWLQKTNRFLSDISDQKQTEKQLIESITLIDHLLMHLYSRNSLLDHHLTLGLFSDLNNDIEEIELLILDFSDQLSKYAFHKDSYREQSERLISQISKFFYSDYVKVIIIDDQLAEPWIAF